MRRTASYVVLGGLMLLMAWTFAPAAPSPAPRAVSAADLAAFEQSAPVLADVNEQVERLRTRLASRPDYPPPIRDPFRFGQDRAVRKTPPPAPAAPPVEPPPPVLPALVAITSITGASGVSRSAVFSVNDDFVTVAPGGSIGAFVVSRVDVDAVVLQDPKTGRTFTVR